MLTKPRYQDGFTLVETLVALALLALISVYGLSALSFSRAFDRVGKQIETEIGEELAFERIREILGQFHFVLQDNEKPPLFSGQEKQLQFLALSDGKSIPGGMVQIRLRGNGLGNLVMQWQHYPLENNMESSGEVVVMRNVDGIHFSYGTTLKSGEFKESWSLRDAYPRVVKLSFRKKSNSDDLVKAVNVERVLLLGGQ